MDTTTHTLNYATELEKTIQVMLARSSAGISPTAVTLAFLDWQLHLIINATKQHELVELGLENYWTLYRECYAELSSDKDHCCDSNDTPKDNRFKDPAWSEFPFNYISQTFLMTQDWWNKATSDVRGVNQHHQDVVNFLTRQYLDMISPSNFIWSNPEIINASISSNGDNLLRGFENFLEDFRRLQADEPPVGAEKFIVGKNMATTEGKVIYKNNLIELIQYQATTNDVYAEPVLITPAWIMKYYILDLTSKQSLVKYLVDKGHTVFMISWKNPGSNDADLGLSDYLNHGIFAGLDVVNQTCPNQKVNLVGYCLGGTLAAIAAAYLAKIKDDRLASLTLFAAQTDFTEPGELGLFIDESQIAFLESMMRDKGYLDTHQMAGVFYMLRSNDLIWSRMVHDYMLGKRGSMIPLMAWNADATRLPYKMHSEYLRHLFLNNELSTNKFEIDDKTLSLQDIKIPVFAVATEKDHVSPWRSVFKINSNTDTDINFVLTTGGHNAGIVNVPKSDSKRQYRMSSLESCKRYVNPDNWYHSEKPIAGSWWPAWENWLVSNSTVNIKAPKLGSMQYKVLYDAPGEYVMQK